MRNRKKIAAVLVILSMLLVLLAPMPAMAKTPTATITPKSLAPSSATAGQKYSQTAAFTATGTGFTGLAISEIGALPAGMDFGTDKTTATFDEVYGTPTEAGSFPIEIDADVNGTVYGHIYTNLTVKAPTIKIAGTLAAVSEDVYYNTTSTTPTIPTASQISATETGNSSPGITFSEIGALPSGLNFSTAGAVYGRVLEAGSFPFAILATDANGFTASKSYTLTVKAPNITITTTLPTASAGATYTGGKITAKETNGTISTVTVSGLPTGLNLAKDASGTVSGTVYQAGIYPLWVTATDSNGVTFTKSASLTVKAPNITITATLPTANAGASYTATKAPGFTAKDSGNKNPSFTYSQLGLPSGLSLSGTTGAVTGTPTVAGSFLIQVDAFEVYNGTTIATAYGTFSLTVKAPTITLALASGSSLTLHPGNSSVSFTAGEKTNANATFTYTESGKLPTGLSCASSGTISGTLAAKSAGSYPILICATDNHGFTCTKSFTLTAKSS